MMHKGEFHMKVLDSDFLIAVLRKEPEAKAKIEELMTSEEIIATTIFNAQEVLFGALLSHDPQNYPKTQRLLGAMNILDYNIEGVHRALDVQLHLHKKGARIGIFDEMIAGICLANSAILVTRNIEHFSRVSGLKIEKW